MTPNAAHTSKRTKRVLSFQQAQKAASARADRRRPTLRQSPSEVPTRFKVTFPDKKYLDRVEEAARKKNVSISRFMFEASIAAADEVSRRA